MNPALTPGVGGQRVLADAIPGTRVRDALLIVAGAALTALCAQISIHVPGSDIPITGQTFAVMVAGASLGTWRGATSQLLYLVAGLALPIYAGGASGTAVLFGAGGGYIFGFVIAAALVGWAAEHGADRRPALAAITFALGQLAIFGIGVPWYKVAANLSWGTAIHEGFTIFIIGGIVKAILAGLVMPSAWRFERSVARGQD